MREFSTPMMQQYMQVRQQYPDCMLFFRLGDFYELFLDDATVGARILGITLTRRPRGKDGDIPMAGVPFHSADTYIAKLLRAGKKIAICEQVSEPNSKGIVDRKVVRIITPGTILDDTSLEHKKHNYIMSVSMNTLKIGLAAVDLLTGDFFVTEVERGEHDAEQVGTELLRFDPSECIVSLETYDDPEELHIVTAYHPSTITYYKEWEKITEKAEEYLTQHFSVQSIGTFGLEKMHQSVVAAAAVIGYVNHTQQGKVSHLNFPKVYSPQQSVLLDPATIANLELFATIHTQTKDGSLLTVLDKTETAMGGRLLRSWLNQPLREVTGISERHDGVAELYQVPDFRISIQKKLKNIFDMERLLSKLSLGFGTAASVLNIADTLKIFLAFQPVISKKKSDIFNKWEKLPATIVKKVVSEIIKTLVEKLNEDSTDKGIIKPGVHAELDELRAIFNSGKEWITDFEIKERARTGISSLKCRYNQVFGFYIEISQSNLHLIPSDYNRKQTLVNAERFITPELKKQEELILGAEEKINEIERALFLELTKKILAHLDELKIVAKALAELDCMCSFAQLAQEERYVRPSLNTNGELKIIAGKHPVLADIYKESCVPNDVLMNAFDHQLLLITGPNMAGKSVYMRQIALLVLLAHIGSFVPARSADIPLVDRIFVRSGAADNISKGMSTFMVEMVEAAHILHQATSDSLVIMDEIGRGTSTYDGISIAWAIAEYLVSTEGKRPKVLFATHYHELQALEEKFPHQIKNFQVVVKEQNGKPVFLYTIKKGAASHSFGIAVAQLAGLPEAVLSQAKKMLLILEDSQKPKKLQHENIPKNNKNEQVKNSVISELLSYNVNNLTPIQALEKLAALQVQAKKN